MKRKRMVVVVGLVAALATVCVAVVLWPTPYWAAYCRVRLGTPATELDRLASDVNQSPLNGERAFLAWEGVVDGQHQVVQITDADRYRNLPFSHPVLSKSQYASSSFWTAQAKIVDGRTLITDGHGRIMGMRWGHQREVLLVTVDEHLAITEKMYFRNSSTDSFWETARDWVSSWSSRPGLGIVR